MPVEISLAAIVITAVAPIFLATGAFFASLNVWIGKQMRSDPAVQQRLQLAIFGRNVTWSLITDASAFRPWPRSPLIHAVVAGLAAAAAETALFASGSGVQSLWYRSGGIAAAIVLPAPFIVAWLCRHRLHRHIDRKIMQYANDSLAHTFPTLVEIGSIAWRIDTAYESMGLHGRIDAPDLCRLALLEHAEHGDDATLTELIGIRNRLEHDLRSIQYCASLLANARAELEQVQDGLKSDDEANQAIAQVESWLHSHDLTSLLEAARWPEAAEMLEAIRFNLRRLLDVAFQDASMSPSTAEDAYRILNVTSDTTLDKIKAVVKAFQRVWHPDLARNEADRQRCTSKMQQINAAWDLIRRARAAEQTTES